MSGNKIKLTYFDSRGRAEVSRMILAQANVNFEDARVTGEEWQKLKPCKYFFELSRAIFTMSTFSNPDRTIAAVGIQRNEALSIQRHGPISRQGI